MRYTGPTTRINRRFKTILFPATKAYERKPYLPGIHGAHLRRRVSDYAKGLTEKQKLRFMFGLSEKQSQTLCTELADTAQEVTVISTRGLRAHMSYYPTVGYVEWAINYYRLRQPL